MRKAEKRRLGRIKLEKDLAESKASGLQAQAQDRKAREKRLQDVAAERAKNTYRSKTDRNAAAKGFIVTDADLEKAYEDDDTSTELEFGCGIGA